MLRCIIKEKQLIKDDFYTKNIVNTVGAGDALFSSFLHFYIASGNLEESLVKAQIFAGIKIGSNGAAKGFVREEEVNELFRLNFK